MAANEKDSLDDTTLNNAIIIKGKNVKSLRIKQMSHDAVQKSTFNWDNSKKSASYIFTIKSISKNNKKNIHTANEEMKWNGKAQYWFNT